MTLLSDLNLLPSPNLAAGISFSNVTTAKFLSSIFVYEVEGVNPVKNSNFTALNTASFPESAGIVTVTFEASPSEQLFCEIN